MPTHEQRMQKKQAVVQERIAAAQEQRGILLINTGNGKGKSSAAFGVLARALGHGLRAAVVQFVKGRSDTGEEAFFRGAARGLTGTSAAKASPGKPGIASATPVPRQPPGRSPASIWPIPTSTSSSSTS
jgi:ATP:corrinoid adenosyltransferase